jgi:hypothetical protein
MAARRKADDSGLFASPRREPLRARVVAGVDEAGLGPLLGPYTLGWCAFRADDPARLVDLWSELAPAVSREPAASDALAVADSKEVWSRTTRGARRLERVVQCFEALHGLPPAVDARAWFARAAGELWSDELAREPWWSSARLDLAPEELDAEERAWRDDMARLLVERSRSAGIELVALGSRAATPAELNRSFERTGSKGATAFEEVAAVLRILWRDHGAAGLSVVVDRQGGRARYARPLSDGLPGARVAVLAETPGDSRYALEDDEGRRAEVRFVERAESLALPVALASCRAKHARELAMAAFNRHFGALAPDIAPTAGYVEDGRRWLAAMRERLEALGIEHERLVRSR